MILFEEILKEPEKMVKLIWEESFWELFDDGTIKEKDGSLRSACTDAALR